MGLTYEPQSASRLKNLSIPASVAVRPIPYRSAIPGRVQSIVHFNNASYWIGGAGREMVTAGARVTFAPVLALCTRSDDHDNGDELGGRS